MELPNRKQEFIKALPKWKKCRAAAAGEDEVKEAGQLYLPKPSGQDEKEYQAYLKRASFYNATGRTIDGMFGLMFRNATVTEVPNGIDTNSVGYGGLSIDDVVAQAANEIFTVGRAGLMVDFPDAPDGLTIAEAEAAGYSPYIEVWKAENIIDYTINRLGIVTEIWLQRDHIYNRLVLIDGIYTIETYEKKENEDVLTMISSVNPLSNGKLMTEIPFVFISPINLRPDIKKPPLIDLVNLSLSHYRNSADREHGMHWTGLPTPVFKGADGVELTIGSANGISLPVDGDAFMLEFSGSGLTSIREAMIEKQDQMASLGSRMIAAQKKDAETAETASINRAGEVATLQSIATVLSKAFTQALQIVADWKGISGDVSVTINRDYTPTRMDAQTITALLGALQAGRIAQYDFVRALQDGGIIEPDRDPDEMLQEGRDQLGTIDIPQPAFTNI